MRLENKFETRARNINALNSHNYVYYVLIMVSSMPNITLSLPEKLYTKMKMYPEIKWSVVIRKYLEEYIKRLENEEEAKTEEILEELGSLRKELEEISDEVAINIAASAMSKRWRRRSTTRT